MICFNSALLKSTFALFFICLLVTVACNRQVNDQIENTPPKERNLEEVQLQNEIGIKKDELAIPKIKPTTTTQTSPTTQQPKYAFDEFYGEKHFTANYISDYGRKFSELTFLIDTNYIEACPGHYSQIAFYATAPTKPTITYQPISGNSEIWFTRSTEKSGLQTLGNFRVIPKIEDIGIHIFSITASIGKKGEADYVEESHQITIKASCKNTCPPFTEKIIPSFYIPRTLPYDVYITSNENNSSSNNKRCQTAIDIQFKDAANFAVNYQIFEGFSPFIENPLSKQIHRNPDFIFSGTGNEQQSSICDGNYYIELSDPVNGCRTHKAFKVRQGKLINDDQYIFKTDTVYEEKNGKLYKVINNPHPYVKYVKYGEDDYFKVLFNEDIANQYKMDDWEMLEFIKKMIGINEMYDSLVIEEKRDYENIFVYHKDIRVLDYSFTKRGIILEGAYSNTLNVETDNLISKEKAVEIAKLKAVDLGHQLADSSDMVSRLKFLESRNKHTPHLVYLNTKIRFEIIKYETSFIPTYYFVVHNKKFFKNPVFRINAVNGEILEIDHDALKKCKNCNNEKEIIESDCSSTHTININSNSILYA